MKKYCTQIFKKSALKDIVFLLTFITLIGVLSCQEEKAAPVYPTETTGDTITSPSDTITTPLDTIYAPADTVVATVDTIPVDPTITADYEIHIYTMNQMQKITTWGHDIKQDNKALSLDEAACQKLFRDGSFNLLRIPFYSRAHNIDGTVQEDHLVSLNREVLDNSSQWEKITTEGDWFGLRNVAHDKYLTGFENGFLEMASTDLTGDWNEWKLVDTQEGDGWSFLENRAFGTRARGEQSLLLELAPTSNTGSWVQWQLNDVGNGNVHIRNRGLTSNIIGAGNAYGPVINAINFAKANGNPELLASHKIYGYHKTLGNHPTWGAFLTENGIDEDGFAASIDEFIDYIKLKTGLEIKYLAPRCEQGNDWKPSNFVNIVNKLTHSTIIVGPEGAYTSNSDDWWPTIQSLVDIKATHNKGERPNWPEGSAYDWNGETSGGYNNETFYEFFNELNQSFYKGKVSGVVFWGDTHLLDQQQNRVSRFRNELLKASEYSLIECNAVDISNYAAAIAFETADVDQYKIFYSVEYEVEGSIRFNFDNELDISMLPQGAYDITKTSFMLDLSSNDFYGSFDVNIKP